MISADAERSILQVNLDLSKYAKDLAGKVDLFVQGFTQTVFNEVQSGGRYSPGTPVDTGFARANWQGGIGGVTPTPAISAAEARRDKGAGRAAAERRQRENEQVAVTVKAGQVVELANNAPYIAALEDGWSQKAPEGMVKLAILNAQAIADEVAAHVMTMR